MSLLWSDSFRILPLDSWWSCRSHVCFLERILIFDFEYFFFGRITRSLPVDFVCRWHHELILLALTLHTFCILDIFVCRFGLTHPHLLEQFLTKSQISVILRLFVALSLYLHVSFEWHAISLVQVGRLRYLIHPLFQKVSLPLLRRLLALLSSVW